MERTLNKVTLTPEGKALASRLKEERAANIERNNGEYKEEPWYKSYMSPGFIIPDKKAFNVVGEIDKGSYETIEKLIGAKHKRRHHLTDSDEAKDLDNDNIEETYDDYDEMLDAEESEEY